MRTLAEFMAFTVQAAPHTPENYPLLARLKGEDAFAFKLAHSFEHIGKVRGRVDSMLESYGHGNKNAFQRGVLKNLAAKAVFNALRFAALIGMTADELKTYFEQDFPPRS